jgi:hypothetical protein
MASNVYEALRAPTDHIFDKRFAPAYAARDGAATLHWAALRAELGAALAGGALAFIAVGRRAIQMPRSIFH